MQLCWFVLLVKLVQKPTIIGMALFNLEQEHPVLLFRLMIVEGVTLAGLGRTIIQLHKPKGVFLVVNLTLVFLESDSLCFTILDISPM